MNLNPHRPWITPVVIGAFGLSAVTGVLMFFHLDSGLNKTAHEWLSWAMVIGVLLHLLLNMSAFKRYFTQTTARVVVGVFALVLALSFAPHRSIILTLSQMIIHKSVEVFPELRNEVILTLAQRHL